MMIDTPIPVHRYAVYFAPAPKSLWWQAGSQWLWRCAAGGVVSAMPAIPGLSDEDLHQVTAAPRRYGWHATLKAPFALAAGVNVGQLVAALRVIAKSTSPFDLPPLRVALLDDFLALVPQPESLQAKAVAARCVTELYPLAAPLTTRDVQRRRQTPLSDDQDALLLRWGYPFVLDQYQFHCSLTGTLETMSPQQVQALQLAAQDWFAPLPACRFESLALFVEPSQGADFVLQEHVRFEA